MITVHPLENSCSQRVLWLLEELGIDYKIKIYQRDPKTKLAPAALKKIHPLGKSPVAHRQVRFWMHYAAGMRPSFPKGGRVVMA